MPDIPSHPRVQLTDDAALQAFHRLWAAYELAQQRTARYAAEDNDNLEGARFHETLLEHLAYANEGGFVDLLAAGDRGILLHVSLWEDDSHG